MVDSTSELLPRYLELYHYLWTHRRRFTGRRFARIAAVFAGVSSAPPRELGARIVESEKLLQRLPWYDALRGQVAVVAAAVLSATGTDTAAFLADLHRARRLFREERLPRGGLYESMAILVLLVERGAGGLSRDDVARLHRVFRAHKEDHKVLVGSSSYPLCAALSTLAGDPTALAARIEELYKRLTARGFRGRADRLLTARILSLSKDDGDGLTRRLEALLDHFRGDGVRIWASDAAHVAPLAYFDAPPQPLVQRVRALREALATLRPRPGRDETFTLACALASLELSLAHPQGAPWTRAGPALELTHVARLVTAVIAASSGGGAAAAIAASG